MSKSYTSHDQSHWSDKDLFNRWWGKKGGGGSEAASVSTRITLSASSFFVSFFLLLLFFFLFLANFWSGKLVPVCPYGRDASENRL